MIPLSLTRPAVAAALLLAITVLCYLPGLPGGFLFDDFPNIVNNDRLLITDLSLTSLVQAAQSGISGANGRPLSMLSLGINHALFGVNPGAFKAVNLGIHLIGGILVLLLARRLLQLSHSQYEPAWRDRVSLFIAAIWLLHPIQLTANLYVVQRMASLASVLLLLSLLIYVIGRQRQMQDQRGGAALILAALFLVTPLAFLAKENGALAPPLMLTLEFFLFRLRAARRMQRWFTAVILFSCVAIPMGWGIHIVGLVGENVERAYALRDFTLAERLMSEARALWFYLGLIAVPDINRMSLFHDAYPVSRGLFAPWTTLPAIVGILGLGVTALLLRNRLPLVGLGIAIFLVGHSVESSVIPLELVFEHRNYFPLFGVLIAAIPILLSPRFEPKTLRLRQLFLVTFCAMLAVNTGLRSSIWGDPKEFALFSAENQLQSPRAQYTAGQIISLLYLHSESPSKEVADIADKAFQRAQELETENPLPVAARIKLAYLADLPLGDALLAELQQRMQTRTSNLQLTAALRTLIHCPRKDGCALSEEDMHEVFTLALDNRHLSAGRRAHIHDLYARYHWETLRNGDEAARHFMEAARINPREVQHRLNLIRILITARRNEWAARELDALEASSLGATVPKVIEELRVQLRAAAPAAR